MFTTMADFITTGERESIRPFILNFAKAAGGGGKNEDDDSDDDDDDSDDDDDGSDDDDDELADLDEDELRAELKKTKASLAKASGSSKSKRARIAKLTKEIETLRGGGGKLKKKPKDDDDEGPDLDELRDEARREGAKAGNDRVKKAEAKSALIAAGVDRTRVARFVGMIDLDEIDIDEDGNVDEDALDEAIEALKEDVPEAFARKRRRRGSIAGGSDRSGEGDDTRRREPKTASERMAAQIMARNKGR